MEKIQKIPQQITKVGFDVDETISHMLGPHVEALEQITNEFERASKIPAQEIRESIARVFEKHGTADYHRLIQEMDCFNKVYQEKQLGQEARDAMRDQLVEIGRDIFKKVRSNHDQSVQGVEPVLKALNDHDIECFAFSNGPIYRVLDRVKRAQLADYFKLILGLRDQADDVFPDLMKIKMALGEYEGDYKWRVAETPKPNANLAEMLEISPEEVRDHVAFVGDSYSNDMGLAMNNGCVGFHAKYGKLDPFIRHRLRQFSTEKLEARFREGGKIKKTNGEKANIHELNKPSDLLRYLGIRK